MPSFVPVAHHGATVPLMYCTVLVISALCARYERVARSIDRVECITLNPLMCIHAHMCT
jgi:hypothetical protein